MPKPVKQEDLDFVSCENDRYESEIFKWKNDRLVEAIIQEELEFEKETYKAKAIAHKKYEAAEQKRLNADKEWQKYWEQLERKRQFESEQARWRQMAEEYDRKIKALKQAEEDRKKREEEAKRQEILRIQNKKLEQEAALAEEKRKKEEALKAAENAKKVQDNAKTVANDNTKNIVTDEILKQEQLYRNMLKTIHDKFSKNPQLKSATTEARKNITLGLNILTNGRAEIIKIATQFDAMLRNNKNNSDVYYFLINYIAKGVVKHAEIDVVSKESAAFPFAHLCVLICTQHTEFMEFLMTRLVKKCPYVLPRYYSRQANQSLEEYKKQMSYKPNEDEDAYVNRMCAIVALYCAIMQTQPLYPNLKNPYGIDNAWTYLARLMNLRPQKITPSLLYICLKITGSSLLRAYNQHALKLFSVVYKSYVQKPPLEVNSLLTSAPAAMSRLRTLLEDASKKGQFPVPEGQTPD
ncbi:7801_t:CDS:2 [Dentiscutata erythropus]|uniref:mRNA export factor GLE1 n=1 Tax=Dentiscutata erythropus TaxID=1348616 RepID=A0A9N9AH89_9GLOM|nr:7801_t:CDS:2 [Dentiscutata erythropus]